MLNRLISQSLILFFVFNLVVLSQNLLRSPQKIVIDKERERILVSNYGDDNLIEIDKEGNQAIFIENSGFLDGMQIVGNVVYGACGPLENAYVRGYDLDTKEVVLEANFPGFINVSSVITDSSGHIFLSESYGGHRIIKLRISDGNWWVFASGIKNPNGMIYEKDKNRILVIGDIAGSPIQEVSLTDSSVSQILTTGFNRMDGIEKDNNGNYYITGYYSEGVYRYNSTFTEPPELIYRGTNIVYPTYDQENHTLWITLFGDNSYKKLDLATPSTPKNFDVTPVEDGFQLNWKNPANRLDGSPLNNFTNIFVYRDSLLFHTIQQTSGDTNKECEYRDNSKGWHSFYLIAEDKEKEPFLSFPTEEFRSYSGKFFLNYRNDFEVDDELVTITGTWDTTSVLSSNGRYSITDSPMGDYNKFEDSYILLPPNIVGENISLQFDHIGIIKMPSIGYVEITNDFGKTFNNLFNVDAYMYDEWKDSKADPEDWKTEIISLDEYLGDTVSVRFRLNTGTRDGVDGWYIDNIKFESVTGIEDQLKSSIKDYKLYQNSPNPFNPETVIRYRIGYSSNVDLTIYDLLGREIIKLVDSRQSAGTYSVKLESSALASGTYIYQLKTDDFVATKKMVLLK